MVSAYLVQLHEVKTFKYADFFSFFMNKKGMELTLNYIILIILGLLVLIVVGLIFREQIITFIENIRGVSSGLELEKATEGLTK